MGPTYAPGPELRPLRALPPLGCSRTPEGGDLYCLHPTCRGAEVQTKANSVKVMQPVVDRAGIWTHTAWSPSLRSPAPHRRSIRDGVQASPGEERALRGEGRGGDEGWTQPSGFRQHITDSPHGHLPWLFARALPGADRRGQSVTGRPRRRRRLRVSTPVPVTTV